MGKYRKNSSNYGEYIEMKKKNHYTGQDLTFVICAYRECQYLEDCIKSLMRQTKKAKILVSTSTPNQYIQELANKYHLEIRVNPNGGQVKDYNFAMEQAETELVILAHQDEIFSKYFVQRVIEELNKTARPIIAFTNYLEMHNNVIDKKPSTMVKIKRLMLLPLCIRWLGGTGFGKWIIQCIGDPITHPTVVCVKKEMPKECFREEYKASMDWDLWQRLSKQKGSFVYVRDILLYHRMNNDNQTVQLLRTSNARYHDEYEIMCRFWPKPIAKFIMHFYKKSAKFY